MLRLQRPFTAREGTVRDTAEAQRRGQGISRSLLWMSDVTDAVR